MSRVPRRAPTGSCDFAPHLLVAPFKSTMTGPMTGAIKLVEEAVAEALALGGAVGPPLGASARAPLSSSRPFCQWLRDFDGFLGARGFACAGVSNVASS